MNTFFLKKKLLKMDLDYEVIQAITKIKIPKSEPWEKQIKF